MAAEDEALQGTLETDAGDIGGDIAGDVIAGARALTVRSAALWVHRYVGLLMTVFLVVAGVTGSLLAFYVELDEALNPNLYRVTPAAPGEPTLDPFEQREALQRQLPPGLWAHRVSFEAREGVASLMSVSAVPGVEYEGDDEFFLDPYSGRVLGSRHWGELSQGMRNVMPFLYRLHYSLALGEVGSTLFGIVALLWTLDCFVGGYLTLPAARRGQVRRGGRAWLARWKPAWLVRGGQLFSWIFTWHRASGLWVWALLLVFAWSAVGLNLREVYHPVMNAVFGLEERAFQRLPKHDAPPMTPELGWLDAHRRGRALMAEQALERGFEVLSERRLVYDAEFRAFRYQVQSSFDVSDRYAATTVWFDAESGALLAFEAPTGQSAGQTITTWIYQLHFGAVRVLGFPYRIAVCLLGVATAVLSITGAWIWWVKRSKRSKRMSSQRGPASSRIAASGRRNLAAIERG
jgi:uncharacterized iron-regulated membrane protein